MTGAPREGDNAQVELVKLLRGVTSSLDASIVRYINVNQGVFFFISWQMDTSKASESDMKTSFATLRHRASDRL